MTQNRYPHQENRIPKLATMFRRPDCPELPEMNDGSPCLRAGRSYPPNFFFNSGAKPPVTAALGALDFQWCYTKLFSNWNNIHVNFCPGSHIPCIQLNTHIKYIISILLDSILNPRWIRVPPIIYGYRECIQKRACFNVELFNRWYSV